MDVPLIQPSVTFRPSRADRRVAWFVAIVGGCASLACVVILATRRHAEQRDFAHVREFNAMIVACAAIVPALMLFVAGVLGLRGPSRVTVRPDAIEIVGAIGCRRIAWRSLASAVLRPRAKALGGRTLILELIGLDGRRRATLPVSSLKESDRPQPPPILEEGHDEDFDVEYVPDLLDEVAARLPVTVGDLDCRTSCRIAVASMTLMAIASATAFVWGAYDRTKNARFATTDGRTVEGRLIDAYVLGSTPWVRYSFVDESGRRFQRETTMHRAVWNRVRGSPTIDIDYLRSDPSWNRLNVGEAMPPFGLGWMFGSAAFFAFTAANAIFLGLGYDFRLGDGEPGARFTRHGGVVWRSKTNAAAHEARQRVLASLGDSEPEGEW